MTRILILLATWSLLLSAGNAIASDATGAAEIPVDRVLALGPLPIAADLASDSDKAEELQRAAIMQLRRHGLPDDGQQVSLFGQDLRWRAIDPGDAGADRGLWLWAVQVEASRYVEGTLSLAGLEEPVVWRNGIQEKNGNGEVELKLATGSHSLWLLHGGRKNDEPFALTWKGKHGHDRISTHLQPWHRVSARQLTNAETVSSLAISPDGRQLAIALRSRDDSAGIDINRLEIRELAGNRVIQQWLGQAPSELSWSPDGRWLALRQGKNLWLRDNEDGGSRLLLAEHEHLGAWRWHPDSRSILFHWDQPFEDKDAKVRRLRGLEDRWRTFRDNAQLFQVDLASGLIRPLTAKDSSVTLLDIHPDGRRLLLSQREVDYAEPPHSMFRLFELSLPDLSTREVARPRQFNTAVFADDGYWLLAGPGLAQGDGSVLADGEAANDYEGELYRLDADGRGARSVSRDFDPSIGGIERLANGDLLLPVTEGDRALLYRFRPGRDGFQRVDIGVDVMEGFVASRGRDPTLALYGTDADRPQRVHVVDLQRNTSRVLVDSAVTGYAQTRFGEVRDWRFTNANGDEIDGRYYLPPDFDADRRYPLIVYYYGGTTPVNRQFTGRYPFHLWAANGYVIYVLQPRGTIGYGQHNSALHVNAWGRHAADDIIEGTRAFTQAHPFVDPDRIGNIGASYGGFMTMYVATRTDLYAASISHAGISNLSGYWGQGWWGYGYSGIASRDSFPWNNRELYVDHSPVYNADRITTPLLLLTGDADTNVPPGESHTMYTALKLLGREVELVEVPGEDHHILDREKRYVWWDTILAWYDRWLKDEPQWWHALYPETAP